MFLIRSIYIFYGILYTYPLIFLSIYAYELNGYIAAALLYVSLAFILGIFPRVIAPISDKTGYRIRYAGYGISIGSLIMIITSLNSYLSSFFLIGLILLASSFISVGQPLFLTYESERSKYKGESVGIVFFYINIGYLVGSIIFGYALDLMGFLTVNLIIGIFGAILGLISHFIKEEKILNKEVSKVKSSLLTGLNRFNFLLCVYIIIPAYFFSIVPVYFILYLSNSLFLWGVINLVSTLTSIIASYYVGKMISKFGYIKTLCLAFVYYPLYYYLLLNYQNILLFTILYSIPAWLFLWIPVFSYTSEITKGQLATAISNVNFFIGIFRSLGGVLGGVITSYFSLFFYFYFVIFLSIILSLAIIFMKKPLPS